MIRARDILFSFWFLAGALTAIRIIALMLSPANLGPDESQYWFWSQTPAFGYFSKPPMIAWAISATTGLFGDAEWAVRLSAPLLHFGAASFLYLTAALLFDRRIAFWTGLAWITIPGVILSSFLMTTDAPLLFFWSGAIYALSRIATSTHPKALEFVALGAAIGFGFLSKYAMIYFPAGVAAALLFEPTLRRALLRPGLIITVFIAAVLIAPNLIWNAQNDFQTLSHTGANAHWDGDLFQPLSLIAFLASQLAVAGPAPILVLVIVAWTTISLWMSGKASGGIDKTMWRTLLILALTPIVIVSAQSFISRAHANWAAAAYPSTMILATALLFSYRYAWLAKASVGLNAALSFVFLVAMTNFSIIDRLGLSHATAEIRGWKEQTDAVADAYDKTPSAFDAIAIDDRSLMGAMLYYQRDREFNVVALDPNLGVHHHYEAFVAMDPARHKRVLFVSILSSDAHVNYRFRTIEPLGSADVTIGEKTRTYSLFDISEYYGDTL